MHHRSFNHVTSIEAIIVSVIFFCHIDLLALVGLRILAYIGEYRKYI